MDDYTAAQRSQPKIKDFFSNSDKYKRDSTRQKTLDHRVAYMIAKDMRPASIVQGKGFSQLIKELDPRYNLPSRAKITQSLLPGMKQDTREKLKSSLQATEWAALTTDMWSSRNNTPFMTVTAHYLDDKNILTRKVLGCEKFSGRHTAENIQDRLQGMIKEYGLEEKIIAVTSDNAHNVVRAIVDAGLANVPCYAHKLNLCAQDCLDQNETLKTIRQKVNDMIKLTHQGHFAKEEFERCQARLNITPPKVFIKEVRTRWNSCFLMLERVLSLRDAVTLFLAHEKVDLPPITPEEWAHMKVAIDMLKPLYEATNEISGENYVTASTIIPMTKTLLGWYAGEARRLTEEGFAKNFCDALLQSLNRRYRGVEDSEVLVMATLLDPRYKKAAFRSVEKASQVSVKIVFLSQKLSINMLCFFCFRAWDGSKTSFSSRQHRKGLL